MLYGIFALAIAIAIINKSKLSNWYLIVIVPALVVVLWILWSLLGVIFSLIIIPALVIGAIAAGFLYFKDSLDKTKGGGN